MPETEQDFVIAAKLRSGKKLTTAEIARLQLRSSGAERLITRYGRDGSAVKNAATENE